LRTQTGAGDSDFCPLRYSIRQRRRGELEVMFETYIWDYDCDGILDPLSPGYAEDRKSQMPEWTVLFSLIYNEL
jgi:hypothetical protein